jgi:putative transposase
MARKRRFIQAGFCYHVMLRGNGGQDIFKDDADRTRFCLLLQYAKEKHQFNIHGFCLMSNHVHFIIQPLNSNLTSGMHSLAFRYAQHFNRKYKRRGYLYQGRYKAVMVQSGTYLLRLIRYVHLNPVRAGIVRKPEEYIWSSQSSYIKGKEYTWLDQTLVIDAFGGVERLFRYTQMDDDKAREEAIEIRKSFQRGAYGDEKFLEEWCPILREGEVGENSEQRDSNEVSIECIVEIVCGRFEVNIEDVRSDKRTKSLVQARTVMASLTHRLDAGTMTSLGKYIFRDGTSLAKLARKIESDSQLRILVNELSEMLIEKKDSSI